MEILLTSKEKATFATRKAYEQQMKYGFTNESRVPRVPGVMGQKNKKSVDIFVKTKRKQEEYIRTHTKIE